MIQTQLLKHDPPYQIISAKGLIGIQVATLIVTKEVDPNNNRLGRISDFVTYHSYPVVNYGLKQGLDEKMKYNRGPWNTEVDYEINTRLQPEGAVWSGVEIKDVRVLGLAGAENIPININTFVWLIPSVMGFDPHLNVWDESSASRVYELEWGLKKVGLKVERMFNGNIREGADYPIQLKLEHLPASDLQCVKVLLNEGSPYDSLDPHDEEVCFRCLIDTSSDDSIIKCAMNIASAMNGLTSFLPKKSYSFLYTTCGYLHDETEKKEAMSKLKKLITEDFRSLRH
jgi:hypothetical protein